MDQLEPVENYPLDPMVQLLLEVVTLVLQLH